MQSEHWYDQNNCQETQMSKKKKDIQTDHSCSAEQSKIRQMPNHRKHEEHC